jgi:hypothetical protein
MLNLQSMDEDGHAEGDAQQHRVEVQTGGPLNVYYLFEVQENLSA